MHAHGLALAVCDYRAQIELPQHIRRQFCPKHGPRRSFLPGGFEDCTCGDALLDVLLMREGDLDVDHNSPEADTVA
jgi:hypothetical protein